MLERRPRRCRGRVCQRGGDRKEDEKAMKKKKKKRETKSFALALRGMAWCWSAEAADEIRASSALPHVSFSYCTVEA